MLGFAVPLAAIILCFALAIILVVPFRAIGRCLVRSTTMKGRPDG